MVRMLILFCALLALQACSSEKVSAETEQPAEPQIRQVEHPFMLWTTEEAKALRERIENDPLAKKQYEHMAASDISRGNRTMWNLFNYMVMGDEQAGEQELKQLRSFIGRKPEPMTWDDVDLDTFVWNEGMPSRGDRHQRDEQTLNVLRYDVLYHQLTEAERKGVQDSFKAYIEFHLKGAPPRHPAFKYDRTSWLPNMHWPRVIGTHLMAAALQDQELIKAMHESDGGWKFYFDEYLADGMFYMEEFGKYYSNIGSKLMYCEALDRLNLNEYGYGYVGKGGATMRKHLEMLFWIGYPRLEAEKEHTSHFMAVSMGDAKDMSLVNPRDARGRGGSRWWSNARMNGPLPKLGLPGWFEIAHRRWPDAGFDYFLGQLHAYGEDVYLPSLYWGLEPIRVEDVRDKAPAVTSYVAKDRGFAMLRMEHSGRYWDSPRPAVSLQAARYYVHYVHDSFSIMQYVSHNRLLYHRMGTTQRGYAGNDAWRDHVRGHSGVVVDGLKARPVARGDDGRVGHRYRYQFEGPMRFTAVRAQEVYPDVDMERALFLTDEYLLDVYWLTSPQSRFYDWQVLALAKAQGLDAQPWMKAEDWKKDRKIERIQLADVHVMHPAGEAWHATLLQSDPNPDQPRGVGVRVHMLGEGDTFVLASRPPGIAADFEGMSLLASRDGKNAVFAALHVPYEKDTHPVNRFERIQQTEDALAVRITGEKVNDRILYAWGDANEKAITLGDDQERFTFTGHAHIRITTDQVIITGQIQSLSLRVTDNPKLVINDKPVTARIVDGVMTWQAD